MRACATVQQLPCHGSYCELILSLARTSCRLSFPPTLLPLSSSRPPSCWPVARHVRLRNPIKSTLAHDAVAAVVLHKHNLIIRVGAGLIHFVYGSHSRLAADLTLDKNLFSLPFSRGFVGVKEDEANEQHKRSSRPRRSKRLPRNGRLNRLNLCQGIIVK